MIVKLAHKENRYFLESKTLNRKSKTLNRWNLMSLNVNQSAGTFHFDGHYFDLKGLNLTEKNELLLNAQ